MEGISKTTYGITSESIGREETYGILGICEGFLSGSIASEPIST